jgi:hypothetical protein
MACMRFPLVQALALLLAASAASADLLPFSDTIQVTNDPAAFNFNVATAVQAHGSFLLAWKRVINYPDGNQREEVVEQAFDVAGATLGPPQVLDAIYDLFGPAVVALPDGHYVVAWTRNLGPWAQIVDANGALIGGPVVLPGSPPDEAGSNVRLAAMPHGFAALWKHGILAGLDPSGAELYSHDFLFRQFGDDGTPQGPVLAVTSPSTPSTANPEPSAADVAALPGGGFILVWSEDLPTAPTSTVQALLLDAQGFPTASPALAIDSYPFTGGMVPRVLVEPDGSCEFLWTHNGTLTIRRFGPSGLGPIFFSTAVQAGAGFQAATDQRGHLLATAGTADVIYAGDIPHGLWLLDDSGQYSAGPIAAMNTVLVTSSALAANGGGTTVVAWLGNGGDEATDHYDVFAHRFRSTCIPGGRQLCLGSNGRFALEADWRTADGTQGPATPVPLVSDTGGFWFFAASNVELLAKVLDGRAVNGDFWVLWGGMTNLDVTLRVTDKLGGSMRTYTNPAGSFPSQADVNAFPDKGPPPAPRRPPARGAFPTVAAAASCTTAPTALCLHGRFLVTLQWDDGAGHAGAGQAIPATDDSGYLWFFAPGNIEMAVKVLDGTPVNGHFWVFAAGLTDVNYVMTVVDTATGAVRTYQNPFGVMRSFGDTAAF